MEPTEWAWLAGMMNGDGCFHMSLRKVEKRWKCELCISLTQTDPCIIERASQILIDGIGVNPRIQEIQPSGAGVNLKYQLRVGKMSKMADLIDNLLPYMVGMKQAKAKLMRRYIDNRMKYEGLSRRENTIEKDPAALKMACEFYDLNKTKVPKEIVEALRDYPQGVGASAPKCEASAS